MNTRLKTLELGVGIRGVSNRNRISYLGNNQPVGPEGDPAKAFARVFSNFTPTAPSGHARRRRGGGDEEPGRAQERAGFRAAPIWGGSALDCRRTSGRGWNGTWSRCASWSDRSATRPAPPPGRPASPPREMAAADYVAQSKVQLDLLFQTLACDQTRLITFIWTGETSQQTYPWLGFNDPHHDMSHRPDGDAATRAKLIKVNHWFAEQVAYLAGKMDGVMEPNGKTMLDNSLVIFTDGLGKGNNHSRKNIPWVLMGSAGGALQTGKFHDFGQQAAQPPAGEHPSCHGPEERDVLRPPQPEGLERPPARHSSRT